MTLHAFIDESGQIGVSPLSSDHFIMSALVCRDSNLGRLGTRLSELRTALGRGPQDRLTWKKIKRPEQRLEAAQMIGNTTFIQTVSIVVCKRYLHPPISNTHMAYLFTLRFLLERLSWLGRTHRAPASYTLSHVKHFRKENLEGYEARLREMGTDTKIDWGYLDPYGGRISNDRTVEALQLADIVASATARAFEANTQGPPDNTYLLAMLPRAFRGVPGNANVLTSYGLKMHPWRGEARNAYEWVANLR